MFYETLDELCKKAGKSVTSVVKELNLSTSKVTAWKNGSVPKGDIIVELANYLNISTDYLLGRTDEIGTYYKLHNHSLTADEEELLSFFRTLDAVRKQRIIADCRDLAIAAELYKKDTPPAHSQDTG